MFQSSQVTTSFWSISGISTSLWRLLICRCHSIAVHALVQLVIKGWEPCITWFWLVFDSSLMSWWSGDQLVRASCSQTIGRLEEGAFVLIKKSHRMEWNHMFQKSDVYVWCCAGLYELGIKLKEDSQPRVECWGISCLATYAQKIRKIEVRSSCFKYTQKSSWYHTTRQVNSSVYYRLAMIRSELNIYAYITLTHVVENGSLDSKGLYYWQIGVKWLATTE